MNAEFRFDRVFYELMVLAAGDLICHVALTEIRFAAIARLASANKKRALQFHDLLSDRCAIQSSEFITG